MKNSTLLMIVGIALAFIAGVAIAQGGYVPNARDTIPAQDCEGATIGDSADIRVSRLVMVGNGGTLRVRLNSGRTYTFPESVVTDGWSAPIVINRVFATGTTATDIVVCR